MAQRTATTVLPSGVEMEVRAFIGGDMEQLSLNVQDKGVEAFDNLLASCINRLGNDTNITKEKVNNMLSNDRKWALIYLRQFSLNFKKTFDFTHEWPVTEDGQGKETTEHSIAIGDFKTIPYYWVKEKMDQDREKAESTGEEYNDKEFPKMYESYDEALANLKQKTRLDNTGVEVHWEILTSKQEGSFANVGPKQRHLNLPIVMRKPKVYLKRNDGKEPVATVYDTSRGDWGDLEQLRSDLRNKEGFVDTAITIKHPTKNKEATIDLLGVLAFFVPSQAI